MASDFLSRVKEFDIMKPNYLCIFYVLSNLYPEININKFLCKTINCFTPMANDLKKYCTISPKYSIVLSPEQNL